MSLVSTAAERLLATRDLPRRAVWAIALTASLPIQQSGCFPSLNRIATTASIESGDHHATDGPSLCNPIGTWLGPLLRTGIKRSNCYGLSQRLGSWPRKQPLKCGPKRLSDKSGFAPHPPHASEMSVGTCLLSTGRCRDGHLQPVITDAPAKAD
jgi:hypothetical protein